MFSKLAFLTLAAAALATGATAALTPFDSEYDYMTMHVRRHLNAASTVVYDRPELYEAFTKVLDKTEHDITMGDLTFPRHFDRLDKLYATAKDKTLVEKIYNETVPLVNMPRILGRRQNIQKLIQDERKATEERVMTRTNMGVIVFHLETFYSRVTKADDSLVERVDAEYNKIIQNAFAKYDFDADVEQFGRQSQ